MTPQETLDHLRSLTDPTPEELREASDLALLAIGFGCAEVQTVDEDGCAGSMVTWYEPTGQAISARTLPHPCASIDDAVRWMVPEGYRVFLERLPVDSGPSWSAVVRAHGKDGEEVGWTEHPALALTIAGLAARLEIENGV